jgi:hypothetical protein
VTPNTAGRRALLVVDDDHRRVADALVTVAGLGAELPEALYVATRSIVSASTLVVHLIANGRRRSNLAKACIAAGGQPGDVRFAPDHVMVIDPVTGRGADCVASTADWLARVMQTLRNEHAGIDVVCGHSGTVRALSALNALTATGTAGDRLFVLRPGTKSRRPTLVGIPFLPVNPGQASARFSHLVTLRQREWQAVTAPAAIVIRPSQQLVHVGEVDVTLTPYGLFWYTAIGRLPAGAVSRARVASEAKALFEALLPFHADEWERHVRLMFDPTRPGIAPMVSKVNGALRKALGAAAAPYEVRTVDGAYRLGSARVEVTLAPGPIRRRHRRRSIAA